MATRKYGVNPGENSGSVTEGVGAATTKLVELTVDCSATGVGGARVITRDEVLEAIEEFEDYIQKAPWPPV